MCDKKCLCKKCIQHLWLQHECGSCFPDSLDMCRAGGIKKCEGFISISSKVPWYFIISTGILVFVLVGVIIYIR